MARPIDDVIINGIKVQKELFRQWLTKRNLYVLEDAAEIIDIDLPEVPIVVLGASLFVYDILDVTTPHNGSTVLVSQDGRRYKRTSGLDDTYVRARANHTGEQAINTVTGLQTALDARLLKTGDVMTGMLESSASNGEIAVAAMGNPGVRINGGGAGHAAYMSFHRPGAYAVHLGLDTDNKLKLGGWSMGAVAHEIWHAGIADETIPSAKLTGTLADARLSPNVPLKNEVNTFTESQVISRAYPTLNLNASVSTGAIIQAQAVGVTRWQLVMGDGSAGVPFFLRRFNTSGDYAGDAIAADPATGLVTIPLLAPLTIARQGGVEGGEINLQKPAATNLSSDITVDSFYDSIRFTTLDGGLSHEFKAWAPAIHTIRHTGDGGSIPLFKFVPGQHHTNILNGTYTGDLWAFVDSALDSGEDIELPRGGLAKITDRLDFVRQGQRLSGPSAAVETAFRFYCDASFNLSAPHVLGGVPYSHVENVFIRFDQPSAATNKAALRQYPWAMSARSAQRSTWKNVGWGAAWNGFDGRGIDLTNHPGGVLIDSVLDGALNVGGQFQDLYDFLKLDKWHGWEFGYTHLSNVRQINYSEPKYLIFGQNIEALDVGSLALWMMTLNSQGASIFKKSFQQVKLDGWASKLEWQNGEGQIANLDILCDKNTDHSLIEVQLGDCAVANMNIRDTNAHNAPMINVTGGRFSAATGKIKSTANGWHSQVSGAGAEMELGKVKSEAGGNMARTLPFHKQTGVTGKIFLHGASTDARGTGSGDFVAIEGASGSRVADCDANGYNLNVAQSLGHLFRDNLNAGAPGAFSAAISDTKVFYQTSLSLTQRNICAVYIGTNLRGVEIEIFTEMHISGVTCDTRRSTIHTTRVNSVTLDAPVVTPGTSHKGNLSHSAVLSGNNILIRADYTATMAVSELVHHIRVNSSNAIIQEL